MVARPDLTPEAALTAVAGLAVLVYDAIKLEAALRTAAAVHGVSDGLADLLCTKGGASAALSDI